MGGFLVRVGAQFLDIDVDAEPGRGRQVDPAVLAPSATLVAISRQRSSKLTKYSVIRKFGITAETCTVAARPISVRL